jgi:hypothetical protein
VSQVTGRPKIQGVFRLKDEDGFPVDMSYELAKERGWDVDWVEALVDAGRSDVGKFDALLAEIELLEPGAGESAKRVVASAFSNHPTGAFYEVAQRIYDRIWSPKKRPLCSTAGTSVSCFSARAT